MTAPRVAIVGGGIAGLSIAHALASAAPGADVVVFEAGNRVGGNIRSERIEGYLCEAGPDGFLDNAPATLELVEAIGLGARVLRSRDAARRRYIFRRGRLHDVPMSAGRFLTTGLLSPFGKLRVLAEPFVARPPRYDESILGFAERHIGREAAEVLVGSMVSGIFAGDANQLSLRSSFPKMHDMEAHYGSLFRAMLAKRRERRNDNGMGAPAGTLTSFVDGMEELARATAAAVGDRVRTGCRVAELQVRRGYHDPTRPRIVGARAFSLGCGTRQVEADAVVLAGPAHESAELLRGVEPGAAALLAGIHTAPLAVVCLGYDEAALTADRGPLDGFGFLVPRREGPRILGALWETSIYPHRAPAGKALLRVMIGGATDLGAVELADGELLATVQADLERTMELRLAPEFVHIVRHWRGIPQYTIGHAGRLARIEAALAPQRGLFLAGNSYRGVSVNACVEDARRVAGNIADHLRTLEGHAGYRAVR
jgi:oxygen-dependent protoporphyrinogen oxidase